MFLMNDLHRLFASTVKDYLAMHVAIIPSLWSFHTVSELYLILFLYYFIYNGIILYLKNFSNVKALTFSHNCHN